MISEAAFQHVRHEAARQMALHPTLRSKLANDPVAAFGWEVMIRTLGHVYDTYFAWVDDHNDTEELVEEVLHKMVDRANAEAEETAASRRLTLQARDRLVREQFGAAL